MTTRRTGAAVTLCLALGIWSAGATSNKAPYRYRVCGDFPNQLVSHVSAIARSARKGRTIEIPNAFVLDEERKSHLPLNEVVDEQNLLEAVWTLGIDAKLVEPPAEASLPCYTIEELDSEDVVAAATILRAFRPTKKLQKVVDALMDKMSELNLTEGVCLHHLSSKEWIEHCNTWGSIDDGVYRGNCLGDVEKTLVQNLQLRSLTEAQRWLFYVGDGNLPQELVDSEHKVVSLPDLIDEGLRNEIHSSFPMIANPSSFSNFLSLMNYVVCRSLPHFVGNSVHVWSALQIAVHELDQLPNGSTYWYNSQSIPLGEYLPIYRIPIVYTYTELSAGAGKFMLKASMSSVKRTMPQSKIHVLYHGDNDREFKDWLQSKGAIVHHHDPEWRASIEEMRQKGDPMRSHLFLHEGNYFGTWQRIDIPKFISSEYCLLLDADTIVVKPFTMKDFGLDITKGLAFSAEADPYLILPWNAGISLMNVPFLRETHTKFIDFIMQHVDGSPYDPDAPSDQGAYLDFYKGHVDFLSIDFNFKPYFQVKLHEAASARVLHFHGPKPHHYIGHFMGLPCDSAAQSLCNQAGASPFLCGNVESFAGNLLHSGATSATEYCEAVYRGESERVDFCTFLLQRLGSEDGRCTSLAGEIEEARKEFDASKPQESKKYVDPGVGEFKYNVCNGLSNQLVYHAIAITQAIEQKRPVAIFDSFIFNGVQTTDENELPSAENSVSFSSVFDVDYLFGKIEDHGIQARLIPSDWDVPREERVPCVGMTPLTTEESHIAMDLVRAFRPVGVLKDLISGAKVAMKRKGLGMANGVCVHHRDGQDWHDHCARWGSIPDGIYRGNCLNETNISFLESLESRALDSDSRWVYYVGDHRVPKELVDSKYTVVTKDNFLDKESKDKLMNGLFPSQQQPAGPFRDLWSLIDFMMCESLNFFVGNSVSSWSAVQLAVRQNAYQTRDAGVYWYNSQSIPLADFLPLYQVPIAFVYTELSPDTTKHLLRASISSVKQHLRNSRINILYHGDEDKDFIGWLRREGVVIHQHHPKWRTKLLAGRENMDKEVNTDVFRRWQRIDVPKYVESEYCLILEPGTIITKPFTMANFGLNLTWSLAFVGKQQSSSEKGIALVNVPNLRRTHDEFLDFARKGFENAAGHQGNIRTAYTQFYGGTVQMLHDDFVFEPHESIPRHRAATSNAVLFHDAEPQHYMGYILGIGYGNTTDSLCVGALKQSYLCPSVQTFARLLTSSGSRVVSEYCQASFIPNQGHKETCKRVLKSLASMDSRCEELQPIVTDAAKSVRNRVGQQQDESLMSSSAQSDNDSWARFSYAASAIAICAVFGATALMVAPPEFLRNPRRDSHYRASLWTSMNVLLTVALAHVIANVVLAQQFSRDECAK